MWKRIQNSRMNKEVFQKGKMQKTPIDRGFREIGNEVKIPNLQCPQRRDEFYLARSSSGEKYDNNT